MFSLLFGMSATDPTTFVVIACFLVVVAVLARYVPAHRATQIDPITADLVAWFIDSLTDSHILRGSWIWIR